jgi:hypothetical protein
MYKVAILVLLILFAVVLYLLLRKTDTSAPLQPWTGDQLMIALDAVRPMLPTNRVLDKEYVNCLVSDLSRKMSFKDFTSKNDTQRYEALFGVKGKWADCTKRDLVNTFMKTTNNGPCSLCVAGTLEQNYSPFEINNKSEQDLIVILQKVFMSCDVCKPQ